MEEFASNETVSNDNVESVETESNYENNQEVIESEQEMTQEQAKKLYKLLVDGEELEVDEEELKRGYGHTKAAQKRMQEAAQTRKEAETVLRLLNENPREVFKLLGMDYNKFAEDIINENLQESLLTEQERELRDYKRKVEQYEVEKQRLEREYREQVQQQEIAKYQEQIQNEIIEVLEETGLPKTDRTIGRIVYYLQLAAQNGYDLSPKDVISHVKNDYAQDFREMLGNLPEAQIQALLGQDIASRVAGTVKQKRIQTVDKSVNAGIGRTQKQPKVMSPKDFFKR
jgi:predicted RNase H-related nuclease YkuK (DUF458 family)